MNSFGRLVAFFALGVIGSYCFMILPLVVAALSRGGMYTPENAGFIGSAPLVGMFVGSVATAAVVHRLPWKATCALAVFGLSMANVASWLMVENFTGLCVAQFAVGFTGVVLMSIAFAYIGGTATPNRNFGWFIALQMTAGVLGTKLVEHVSASSGAGAVFRVLAFIVALALPLVLAVPNGQAKATDRAPSNASGKSPGLLPKVAVLITQIAFGAGIMLIWSCAATIGVAHGISSPSVADMISFALLMGIPGALCASAADTRLPVNTLLVIGTICMVIATLLSALASMPLAFAVGLGLLGFGWNFLPPFQLGISANVDPTGRLVVLNIALVKLGYAIGTAAAAIVAGSSGRYGLNATVAVACFALALASSWIANHACEIKK